MKKKKHYIPVDWNFVDSYLEAGCSGNEIAPHLGMHADTLYRRCVEEKGMNFLEYAAEKRAKGDASLRKVQFDAALSGDKSMMIWLGKNRLKQRDRTDIEMSSHETGVRKLLSFFEEDSDFCIQSLKEDLLDYQNE